MAVLKTHFTEAFQYSMNFCFHVIRELMFFQAFVDQNNFEKNNLQRI